MSKKSIDVKIIRKFILDGRNSGKTDQEIYHELSQKFYDKKTIALLITGTITAEKKKKYKIYNIILLGLIGFFVLFNVLCFFSLIEQTREVWIFLLLAAVFLLVAGYFMYGIATYNGPIYRMCWIFTIWVLLLNIIDAKGGVEILVNVLLTSTIIFLSFYLDKKMFPNYSHRNLKKDNNGEYILLWKKST